MSESARERDVPWQKDGEAIRLFVHLTPKSSKDAVEGIVSGPAGTVLKARVRALPDKGKANQAVEKLIYCWAWRLGFPRRIFYLGFSLRSFSMPLKTMSVWLTMPITLRFSTTGARLMPNRSNNLAQ